jgi:3-methyladenine DNA glycosylase AlkD
MPAKTKTPGAPKATNASRPRMTLAEAMAALEKAGSAQTRQTYARHGAKDPMFGVSFATLKTLAKRIRVDHELACGLWDTGNFDARNLAVKIVDPARMSPGDLDRWAHAPTARMCHGYVAQIVAEGPHARAKADEWRAASAVALKCAGWTVVAVMAMRDAATPDAWFTERLAEIEASIHTAPSAQREAMNHAVIAIGCRSAALRRLATAAAKRIGTVEVDHGDTACKTPNAAQYIDKTWAHSTAKGFATPAAHEQSREPARIRC